MAGWGQMTCCQRPEVSRLGAAQKPAVHAKQLYRYERREGSVVVLVFTLTQARALCAETEVQEMHKRKHTQDLGIVAKAMIDAQIFPLKKTSSFASVRMMYLHDFWCSLGFPASATRLMNCYSASQGPQEHD